MILSKTNCKEINCNIYKGIENKITYLKPIFEISLTLSGANNKYVNEVPAKNNKIKEKSTPRE